MVFFMIGQCHGNSALYDVGVDVAFSETSLHDVPIVGRAAERVVCLSPPEPVGAATVRALFPERLVTLARDVGRFTYRPNPRVVDVFPRTIITR